MSDLGSTGAHQRERLVVDVHLFLVDGDQLLLGQRQNTGFADDYWHVPAGHLEKGESLHGALVRESHEELGIAIDPLDAELAHVMHHAEGRIATFFVVRRWGGCVTNLEPQKCRSLDWFAPAALPNPTVPYCRRAIGAWRTSRLFSIYGFGESVEEAA